jgi:hypothetical protein
MTIREAAERWESGDHGILEDMGYTDVDELCDEFAAHIVASYPPDDADPVTQKKLEAAGFRYFGEALMCSLRRGAMMVAWMFDESRDDNGFGTATWRYDRNGSADVPRPNTMFEFRRLCAALGIELEETT